MPDPKLSKWRDQATIDAEITDLETERQRLADLRADAMYTDMIEKLKVATPTQISNYVDTNVTDLASARTMFKRILLILGTRIRD